MRGTMLIAMLALGPAAGMAAAQDTTKAQQDTASQDTSQVQNPPGYRGMERDTTVFPPRDDTTQAGDETTRIEQMQRQDTLQNQDQNPPGYRGMERDTTAFPLEKDTLRDTTATGAAADTSTAADTTKTDTTTADTTAAP